MKVLKYKNLSVLFCLLVLFCNCSNTGSKTSTEKADVRSENVDMEEEYEGFEDIVENIVFVDKADVSPEQIALIEKVLVHFEKEQFDKIVLLFDDNVKEQINKDQLAGVWGRLNTHMGKYSKSEYYNAEKLDDVSSKVVYACSFGQHNMYFELIFGKGNKIAGIFFKPK